MILYFSGTGNSRHVALSLGNILSEEVLSIPDTDPMTLTLSGKNLIMVFPIYSWGVPPLVLDYIAGLPDSFIRTITDRKVPVLMVATCGDEVAYAPEMFRDAWLKRNIDVAAVWGVIMPNNYVLLPGFNVDKPKIEQRKLDESSARIRQIAAKIKKQEWKTDVIRGSWPKLKTRIIYPLFRRWGINWRKWKATEECVRCGRCVTACPVHNMRMKSGSPSWGIECVSCTACYHICPAKAVSYGKFTSGKGQYHCHLEPLKS